MQGSQLFENFSQYIPAPSMEYPTQRSHEYHSAYPPLWRD